ncbi:MAG TPA: HD domain-containing phosphohydrolase [Actinomycetota bacterium]|nr:HD domain-containing phosphohydrolase [Actinomycetota bacterium]
MTGSSRLADLLAALSVATDHAMGQEPEKSMRAAVLATSVAGELGLSPSETADVYYATLLKHLGCTATTSEEAASFGPDERSMRAVAERTDDADLREAIAFLGVLGRGAGLGRLAIVGRTLATGSGAVRRIHRAVCEVGARMAARLDLGPGVERSLAEVTERWDGKGGPRKLAGEDLSLVTRIAEPATQAVIFRRLGGDEAMMRMLRRREGGMFDPAVARTVRALAPEVLGRLDDEDPWDAVLAAEPDPVRTVTRPGLRGLADAFADMVDLQSTFTLGHSAGVADLAARAAGHAGIGDPELVRIAGLLHDVGRTAVATGVWEKQGPLTRTEWERVRLHAYHTERILGRSSALTEVAAIAAMHHERQDGSGYHRGARAGAVPAEARLLAVADAFHAMTEERPHRPALTVARAAETVLLEVDAGRFDPECARAVLEVAGSPPRRAREPWPAGLSEREVEVLRLVSRGRSNKEIAAELVISVRTAEHHVQHIYGKIGASTRASAAMFAMEHGLLR